jgi:U5 snRNP spliceosome subunit
MWSMPRSVLRIVAVILALCAVGGFVMGLRGTPQPARLPGEGAAGPALEASDARPVDDLVLTPSELTPDPPKEEEKEEEKTEEEAPPVITPPPPPATEAPKAAPPAKAPTPPPEEDRVGDLIDGLTPPPEQPPY